MGSTMGKHFLCCSSPHAQDDVEAEVAEVDDGGRLQGTVVDAALSLQQQPHNVSTPHAPDNPEHDEAKQALICGIWPRRARQRAHGKFLLAAVHQSARCAGWRRYEQGSLLLCS